MKGYQTLADVTLGVAEMFRPPERLTVAEAAAKYRHLNNAPGYVGAYDNDKAPYMVEPMNTTMSRDYTSVVFCGPAQSAKTEALILNTAAYVIKCNPMDMTVFHISQTAARDFSKRRVDRMHRHSKEVGRELLRGQHADNTHDKTYKSGMMFTISWPTINEMSSKPIPLVMNTDYDRMPDDIDGEGSPFFLSQKRTQSFGSLGMTVAESSPGRDIDTETTYQPTGDHEAPPVKGGVLALYNQGDRRRWNWPCPRCEEFFEPSFDLLKWDTKEGSSIPDMARTVHMICPKCEGRIEYHERRAMNLCGVWLREGETISKDGVRHGTPRYSKMASFWLKGPAAAFITWEELVAKFLNAEDVFKKTGAIEDLKTTINTDQGEPFKPRSIGSNRLPEDLKDEAVNIGERVVPADVRALFACCDVQKNRWEVQVMGIRPGATAGTYDIVVIDRFPIIKSERLDEDGERLWVKPATYEEDWQLLVTQVMEKKYPLADVEGTMAISHTFCDSGGKEGVTTKAYDFYRWLKRNGKAERFLLVKGESHPAAPRVSLSFPDSQRKDRTAQARGEIPVLFFHTNMLKDTLDGMLDKKEGAGGKIEFPRWLPITFYQELTAETKTHKGWQNVAGRPNESWDLSAYMIGACVWRRVDKVDWSKPPEWLQPWDSNPLVEMSQARPVDKSKTLAQTLAQLGSQLA